MKITTANLSKVLVGTVAAGAMAVSSASPALARDRDHDGIGAGEVIAGALILGGIAAVASSATRNDRNSYGYRYRDDYRYDRSGYGRYGSRQAVEACVHAAERNANRYLRGRADVTQVTRVSRQRNGYNVRGRIAVNDRGYRWDRRGYDTGSFSCKVRYGRVAGLDYSGIRGLR
ncbi:MAG: hypothetical protein KDE32_00130 [Novosphingobium sp.]|nr:hypothetical protein [Novosphingobium sp.]